MLPVLQTLGIAYGFYLLLKEIIFDSRYNAMLVVVASGNFTNGRYDLTDNCLHLRG